MERRNFLTQLGVGAASVVVARGVTAQQTGAQQPATQQVAPAQGNTSNLFDMDQDAAKTVRRPPKPNAAPSMNDEQRDAMEREIRCQCGCTLDVYICRTTDFSCQVSPAMHRDIMSLVAGGYSAQEIIDAFVTTYGETALMAPTKEGFNLAGYIVPFAALGLGAVAVVTVLKRMQGKVSPAPVTPGVSDSLKGTADEMAKLQAAIRRDD